MAETNDLAALERSLLAEIKDAGDSDAIERVRISALGRKGRVPELMAQLGTLPPQERKAFGQAVNGLKDRVTEALSQRKADLERSQVTAQVAAESVDVTLPVRLGALQDGRIHPVSQVWDEIAEIFGDMGFAVAEGPDIETDDYNFTKLNIPPEHPARQEHDTFYFKPQPGRLAPAPAHAHEPGADPHDAGAEAADPHHRAWPRLPHRQRCDAHADVPPDRGAGDRRGDAPRSPEVVHRGILQGVLRGRDLRVRFRASHFPFTEPSMEVDVDAAAIGKPGQWMEILGSGMVHPKVIANCGLDPEQLPGLRLWHGARPHHDAEVRHPRSARHVRRRPALAEALRLPAARRADAGGRAVAVKFTLAWLKDHLDTPATAREIADRLSSIGLEVESIDDPGEKLRAFTIAKVLEAKRHPNADRLQVCKVDTGSGIVEVVCGAPNARAGMIGVFAPLGTYIPGIKITLEAKPVRGVVSAGMLVSEKELELSDNHQGIIELGADQATNIGKRYVDTLGMGDPVLDVKITPNRPDCTGVRGIARDLAAAGLGKLKPEPQAEGRRGRH